MNARIILFSLVVLGFLSCSSDDKTLKNEDSITTIKNDVGSLIKPDNKGYELMESKCFICHFKAPDPSRKSQMIAPPMLRVQEHYKPVFPNKDEFVKAVMAIVNDPSEENTLMPGAVRKFNVMPKVVYDQKELKLIAEAIFDTDFGASPKGQMHEIGISLNDGKKWELKKESIIQIADISNNLNNFKSDNLSDYNQLGKDIFNAAKKLMADDSYKGEKFEQIHNFFHGVENDMHTLMAIESIDEAQSLVTGLQVKFGKFGDYFEVGK